MASSSLIRFKLRSNAARLSLNRLANHWLRAATALAFCLTSNTSFSEPSYPIKIQADSAVFNEQNRSTEYIGSVILQQGPVKIEAELIKILSDKDGVRELVASGNPVRYTQNKSESKPPISAAAHKIHYFTVEQRMELTGDAFLEQDGQSFRAPRIEYSLKQQTLKALGNPENKNSGRVIMVIPPRTKP